MRRMRPVVARIRAPPQYSPIRTPLCDVPMLTPNLPSTQLLQSQWSRRNAENYGAVREGTIPLSCARNLKLSIATANYLTQRLDEILPAPSLRWISDLSAIILCIYETQKSKFYWGAKPQFHTRPLTLRSDRFRRIDSSKGSGSDDKASRTKSNSIRYRRA